MKLARILGRLKEFFSSRKVIAVTSTIFISILIVLTAITVSIVSGKDNSNKNYTVIFDVAGGSSVLSQSVEAGGHVKRPSDPTRIGYVFDGWYRDGEPWSFDGDTVNDDLVLRAAWREALTVTFDNGEKIVEVVCAKGKPVSVEKAPKVFGSDFSGWYLGGVRWDFDSPVECDMILTAAWSTELMIDSRDAGKLLSDRDMLSRIEALIDATLIDSAKGTHIAAAGADGAIDLTPFLRYMPHLSDLLTKNEKLKSALTSPDGKLYSVPTVTSNMYQSQALAARTEWIKALLNGEGDFRAESSDIISPSEIRYKPTSRDGHFEIETNSGTVIKNTVKSGNIISVMNAMAEGGALDGVQAVNLLRKYIDVAYGGYYGTERANLFIGENAAWCADELVALLRCIKANSYTLGVDSTSGIAVGRDIEYSLVCLCIELFGIDSLDTERGLISLTDSGFIYSGDDVTVKTAVVAISTMIYEGLISLDDGAVTFATYSATLEDGCTELCRPLSQTVTYVDKSGVTHSVLKRSTYYSICDMKSAVSILESAVETDNKRLFAALRFIDILYSDIF